MKINFFTMLRALKFASQFLPMCPSHMLYLIEFSAINLGDPNADPVGVYFKDGTKIYMWKDTVWKEYELSARMIIPTIREYINISRNEIESKLILDEYNQYVSYLNFFEKYQRSWGPSEHDSIDNLMSNKKVFYRVIYEINSKCS